MTNRRSKASSPASRVARRDVPESPDELLRRYVAHRDVQCPLCSYSLRNSESTRCPECGIALELRIGGAESHLRQWLTSLLAVAIPTGFFVVATLGTLYMFIAHGLPAADTAVFVIMCWVLTALYVASLFTLIRARKRFLTLDVGQRAFLTRLLCILSPVIVLTYLGFFLTNIL